MEAKLVKSTMMEDIQVINLNGDIVYGVSDTYRDKISEEIKEAKGYIFDLSEVNRLDSLGFGVIVYFARDFRSKRIPVSLVIQNEFVIELFKAGKLDTVFGIYNTVDEAFAAIKKD